MADITNPLRLAVDSHRAGSGKGCAMNVISWENGDKTITDAPACADQMLAFIVQRVNDTICSHTTDGLLCPTCSMTVLDLAHRTVGTGTIKMTKLDRHRVWVRVAADQARQVAHLNTDPRAMAAILAAEAWADNPSKENAAAANAAYAAAYAAYAAYAAGYAAYAACSANAAAAYAAAAANAAYAACSAYAAAAANAVGISRLSLAHRAIDKFNELTGYTAPPPEPVVVHQAIRRMHATT